jgi:hypothetical protein
MDGHVKKGYITLSVAKGLFFEKSSRYFTSFSMTNDGFSEDSRSVLCDEAIHRFKSSDCFAKGAPLDLRKRIWYKYPRQTRAE